MAGHVQVNCDAPVCGSVIEEQAFSAWWHANHEAIYEAMMATDESARKRVARAAWAAAMNTERIIMQ